MKGLVKLIQTLKFSIGALGNILILMMLIFCIFAIMGCYLFSDVPYFANKDKFHYANEYYNTDNFYFSFLLTFRVTSGENWPDIMKDYSNVNPAILSPVVSQIYFTFLIFFCAVIMLNLFILVVLQQYDEFYQKDDNPIESFSELLECFRKTWNKFSSEDDKGERINMLKVTEFLNELEGNLKILELDEKDKKVYEKLKKKKIKFLISHLKFIT